MGKQAIANDTWGAKGLPQGQPQTSYYDKYGRSFVLPADPWSLEHYQRRGLGLAPPESPTPLPEDSDHSEGSANATRQVPVHKPSEVDELKRLLAEATAALTKKGRGPDKKKRQKRKRERA